MPDATQSARIAQIADLAGPIADIETAIPIDSPARAGWLEVLGHLRRIYSAKEHKLIASAIDVYIDGHEIPARTDRAVHMTRCAAALVRLAGTASRPPVSALAQALVSIWAKAPQGGPPVRTLLAILPPVAP